MGLAKRSWKEIMAHIPRNLVRLDLNHAEEKNSPQFGSPKFPLQLRK
jgi:hypothetical protein